jgi:hypothetical protein
MAVFTVPQPTTAAPICEITPVPVFDCEAAIGITPNAESHDTFVSYWDAIDDCDPNSPYLDESEWYVSPDTTGVNCT